MQRYQLGRICVARIGFGVMQLHIDTSEYYGPAVANELIRAMRLALGGLHLCEQVPDEGMLGDQDVDDVEVLRRELLCLRH